jgi:uncharacterized protein (TIGR03435 family)
VRNFVICAALVAGIASAREFEVASIRPAAPMVAGQQPTLGVCIDGSQFRANNMTLRDYLATAYSVRLYQVEAPDWAASERFNITAKLPESLQGRPPREDELGAMVRKLVEQRFQVKSHRASRDFPVYELERLKGGIRAAEAPLDAPDGNVTSAAGMREGERSTFNLGRGSSLSVGENRIEMKKVSMEVLADILARYVDRPVMDQTGIKSTYNITLELAPGDFQVAMARGAVSSGVQLPPQSMGLLEIPTGDSMHQQLAKVGLKLEARKARLDVIVIDSINRAPSEN